jgi:TonB family protein
MASRATMVVPLATALLLQGMPQATTSQSRTDEQPEVERIVGLSYPRIANLAGVEGTVKLIAVVSPAGTVDNVRVVSGSVYLIESAKQSLLRWRFRCLSIGKPCESIVSFVFKLGEMCDRQSCPTELQIDLPNEITVRAKRVRGNRD